MPAPLVELDYDARVSEAKFAKYIVAYAGSLPGEVMTKNMQNILWHIRTNAPEQSFSMCSIADKYRSGVLEDDAEGSFELKWLLLAARKGYGPALTSIAELYRVGTTPHFSKDLDIATRLESFDWAPVLHGERDWEGLTRLP